MASHAASRTGGAPPSEPDRLAAVHHYEILDSPSDGAFDRITGLAARLLGVPIAIVSIVDEDRIWFKSHHGLDVQEIGRAPGLCASAIMSYEPLLISDARVDPVALSNPLVAGDFGLRFYAAAPLTVAEGHNLGTLCVIDREPRTLTEDEVQTLEMLAGLVVHELEVRLATRKAVEQEVALRTQAVEERRYANELAQTLQASLLPPRLPRIQGIELASRYRAADPSQVGGDFFDVFPLPSGAWGLAIGDVCGKGPEAAALTAAARYALRAAAVEHESPSAVLGVVNEALAIDGKPSSRFCTLAYVRLRPHGGGVDATMASGGHPLPHVVSDTAARPIGEFGTLIGVFPDPRFTDTSFTLAPGETLVLFTDGLSEAPSGEPGGGAAGV